MKKRIRKKLFLKEFRELGFHVRFRFAEDMTDEDLETQLDQFLTEVIEKQGLDFGGSGHHEWIGFVALDRRGSVTEEQRKSVADWLAGNAKVVEHDLSDLRDAWNDNRPWP